MNLPPNGTASTARDRKVCSRLGAVLAGSFLAMAFFTTASAAEPSVVAKDLPRVPPVEAKDALGTFKVKAGFHLELVAAEPLVVDPIAMSFDEHGRLYVVEMRDYSERRAEKLGRIRLLEDTDGDGRFDKSTVFAEGLPWPTAVFCADGGVFVAATPDILFFKDTNGDGRADVRKEVFTGFGAGLSRLNVQALLNSFNWSLDNRIHGATGPNGGSITSPLTPKAKPVDLRGKDFAFDPRDLRHIYVETGGGQHGFSFDDTGRKFVCHNSAHIRLALYEERYAGRNPFYALPAPLADIAVDGPAAEVFRLSPDEPWRVLRTAWRVSGQVPGLIEGGGRASGYFTSATGLTIYRGHAFPEEFHGDAFIADVGSNLIHRKKLYADGVSLIAKRAADEAKVEFIASKDVWFRPVQFANAPDGTLYFADMYREVVEHPWSIPESIKKHLDLNSGNDRGRIYRIVPDGFKQPKLPRLGHATTAELVATLAHPNGWHRDTAARLLYERQDKTAVPALAKLVEESKSPLGRLHALCALDGLNALRAEHLQKALSDADAAVREHAVCLAEKVVPLISTVPLASALWQKLDALADDPAPRVRYQLAFTLGELPHPGNVSTLARLARHDAESAWLRAAILSSLKDGAGEIFSTLSADKSFAATKGGQEFLRQLVLLIGSKNAPQEIAAVLDYLSREVESGLAFSLVHALGEGLPRAGSSLAKSGANLKPVFALATKTASDNQSDEATRLQAIQLLALTRYADSGASLFALLDLHQSQAVQLAALHSLARFTDAQLGGKFVKRWPSFTPRLRSEVLTVLLARPERAGALLKAVEEGTIRRAELSSTQIKFLRTHADQEIHQQAAKLFGVTPTAQRPEIVSAFQPALNLTGDAAHGKTIYLERCSACHRSSGEGHLLGPDLVTVKTTGKEKMLINILDPNREVPPNYLAYLVETKNGDSVIGLIANETATSVTVRQPFGKEEAVLRANIQKMQSQEQSLMPEGLEAGLSHQQMADLLDYIATAQAGK